MRFNFETRQEGIVNSRQFGQIRHYRGGLCLMNLNEMAGEIHQTCDFSNRNYKDMINPWLAGCHPKLEHCKSVFIAIAMPHFTRIGGPSLWPKKCWGYTQILDMQKPKDRSFVHNDNSQAMKASFQIISMVCMAVTIVPKLIKILLGCQNI